jgi:alpha-D-ribose 1-methylphosphonate 5-triphosphate synthase subunit PhnH
MNNAVNMSNLLPGFPDPVLDSQRTFRQVLDAMAHPGRVIPLDAKIQVPRPLQGATAAVCLALLDFETSLWMDLDEESDVAGWLRFHCGCPLVHSPSAARFGLISREYGVPALDQFNSGQDEFPEQSATLIIQVSGFTSGSGRSLRGPGVERFERLKVQGLPDDFWMAWHLNQRLYPLGVDVLFTAGSTLVALPRTTGVEE